MIADSDQPSIGKGATSVDDSASLVADKVREHLEVSVLPAMLTPKQLCEVLQLGKTKTYSMLRRGAIPGSYRVGPKLYRINTKILLESLGKE